MVFALAVALCLAACAANAVLFSPEDPIRDLRFGDVNFVHTTDTHGWLSGHANQKNYHANWGDFISFTANLRQLALVQGQDLLVVDTGDRHDGSGLSDATVPNGEKSLPIFARQQFDLLTIGNHELYEWENALQEVKFVAKHYKDQYVSSNVEIKLKDQYKPFGQRYRYFVTPVQQKRILAFGFLFDFQRNTPNTRVKPIKQVVNEEQWFKDVVEKYPEESLDMIVVVTHVPVAHEWGELDYLHKHLRKKYPNLIIQYFGGHSHIRDFVVFDDKATALESGRFCETVGFLSVDTKTPSTNVKDRFFRSYIDFNLQSFMYHSNASTITRFQTSEGIETTKLIQMSRRELHLDDLIGYVGKQNYYMDYVPIDHPQNLYKLLADKVLPTLEPDVNVTTNRQRIVLINSGGVRYDLYKGPYTIDSHYTISPFKNDWVKVTASKRYATKVADILNAGGYIFGKDLLSTHQYIQAIKDHHQVSPFLSRHMFNKPLEYKSDLSLGYVTHDDFGDDGDDTLHEPLQHYKMPNVIASEQLVDSDSDEDVDLVFFSFITPWVVNALKLLTDKDTAPNVEFYSGVYLGELLDEYVRTHTL